jgi:hypothetical protein
VEWLEQLRKLSRALFVKVLGVKHGWRAGRGVISLHHSSGMHAVWIRTIAEFMPHDIDLFWRL